MLIKYKYELMNEADAGDAVDAGGGSTETDSQVSDETTSNQPDYGAVKAALDKISGGYQEVNQKVEKYDSKMALLDKLESVFTEKKETGKFNPDAINAQNVAEAAKHMAKTGEMTQQELATIKEQLSELSNYKAANEYQNMQSQMSSFWTENVFGDEKSYIAVLDAIGERNPQLLQTLEQAVAEGEPPSTTYLNQVHAAIKDYVLAEILNPDSKVAKSVYSKINQKNNLSKNSTFDGDGFRGGQDQSDSDDLLVDSVRYY